jgi:hypothetical protein
MRSCNAQRLRGAKVADHEAASWAQHTHQLTRGELSLLRVQQREDGDRHSKVQRPVGERQCGQLSLVEGARRRAPAGDREHLGVAIRTRHGETFPGKPGAVHAAAAAGVQRAPPVRGWASAATAASSIR